MTRLSDGAAAAVSRPQAALVARASRFAPLLPTALLGLFLGLPVGVLIVRGLAGAMGAPLEITAIAAALQLSLVTTAVSLALTVIVGTPVALLLARKRPRGAGLIETLIDLPIVLPPAVAGLALLLVFGRRGVVGEPLATLGLEIPFTTVAVILAQTFVAAPFFVRSARSGFRAVDRDLEDAARVDGAGEWAVFRTVTAPLAGSALAAGMVMTWARALGEFGATILFAGSVTGTTQTMPLLVYAEFGAGRLDTAIVAAAVLVAAALVVLVAVRSIRWRTVDVLRSID